MGRAGWTALIAGAVVVAVIVVLIAIPGGLPSRSRSISRHALTVLKSAKQTLAERQKKLASLVEKDAAYLSSRDEVKRARAKLDQQVKALAQADADAVKLHALLDKDESSDETQVLNACQRIRRRAKVVVVGSSNFLAPIADLVRYKVNAAKLADQAAKGAASVKKMPSKQVGVAIKKASKRYPVKEKLQRRLAPLAGIKEVVASTFEQYKKSSEAKPVDYVASGKLAEAVIKNVQLAEAIEAGVLKDVETLPRDIDKVLVDMKRKGGFFHKYDVTSGKNKTRSAWLAVPAALFLKHKRDLGMVVYSKPAGVLGAEAERIGAPPGWNYANRPRYGAWTAAGAAKNAAGKGVLAPGCAGRSWTFNPEHSHLATQLGYAPVSCTQWIAYDAMRQQGRSYYGLGGAEYGTSSARTRRTYGSSFFLINLAAARRARSYRTGGYGRSSYGGYGK